MKKVYFILCFQFLVLASFAQAVPKGMSYQAVARNLKGEIINNQKISLRIFLFGNENNQRTNHYQELHTVTTNTLGLFNVIIGEGTKEKGEYGLIPWNRENIWMEVAIKDKGQAGFTSVSSRKLLAVPYAMYAGTANRLTNNKEANSGLLPPPGVVSTVWSVLGNAMTDASGNLYHINSLGTTDMVDLFLITDNVERFRILKNGDITTKLNFKIEQNLNVSDNGGIQQSISVWDSLIVKEDVLFNIEGGSTLNYGPFIVLSPSLTLLSGTLNVDFSTLLNNSLKGNGPVDLNSRLYVNNMSETLLTGTLVVDKATDLNDALRVNNMSPTLFTGTLIVDKSADLNDSLRVNNMAPTLLTGTLRVDKATSLNDSLSVNNMKPVLLSGTLQVDQDAVFNKKVLISDTTQSLSTATGALVVNGGMGLAGNLNIGGTSAFGGPVGFASPVSITDATQSTSTTTGALKITGGAGIGKNLNVGGTTTINGMTSITDTTQTTSSTTGALKVTGGLGIVKNLNVGGMASVAGMTSVTNATQSTSATTGALKVTGGTGIGLQLNVGGVTSVLDLTQSTSATTGALKVSGGTGIGLQLNVGGMTSVLDTTQSTSATTGALKVSGGMGIGLQLNVGRMTSFLDTTQSTNTTTGALKVSGGFGIAKNLFVGKDLTVAGLTTFNNGLSILDSLTVSSTSSFVASFVNTTNQNGISIRVNNASPGWDNNYMEFRKTGGGVVGRVEGENGTQYINNPTYQLEIAALEYRILSAAIAVTVATISVVVAGYTLGSALSSSTGCAGLGFCATAPLVSLIVKAGIEVGAATTDLVATSILTDQTLETKTKYELYKNAHVGVTYESGAGDYAEWLLKEDDKEVFLPGYIVGLKNGKISKSTGPDSKLMVISQQPIVLGNKPEKESEDRYEKVAFMGQVPVQVMGKVQVGDYILPSGNKDGLGIGVHPSQVKPEDYSQIVGVAWTASTNDIYSTVNAAVGLNGSDISKVVIDQNNKIQELMTRFKQRNEVLGRLVPGYKEEAGRKISTVSKELSTAQTVWNSGGFQSNSKKATGFEFFELTEGQIDDLLMVVEKQIMENGSNLKSNPFWNQLRSDAQFRRSYIQEIQYKARIEVPKQWEIIKQRMNSNK